MLSNIGREGKRAFVRFLFVSQQCDGGDVVLTYKQGKEKVDKK